MAKKKYDIDTKEVEKLASYGCTTVEIADFFGCSPDLITARYSVFVAKGKFGLKKRLRKKQIDCALKGNATLLIWLGKQYLGQSDKQETDLSVDTTQVVKMFSEMVSAAGSGIATRRDNSIPDGESKI